MPPKKSTPTTGDANAANGSSTAPTSDGPRRSSRVASQPAKPAAEVKAANAPKPASKKAPASKKRPAEEAPTSSTEPATKKPTSKAAASKAKPESKTAATKETKETKDKPASKAKPESKKPTSKAKPASKAAAKPASKAAAAAATEGEASASGPAPAAAAEEKKEAEKPASKAAKPSSKAEKPASKKSDKPSSKSSKPASSGKPKSTAAGAAGGKKPETIPEGDEKDADGDVNMDKEKEKKKEEEEAEADGSDAEMKGAIKEGEGLPSISLKDNKGNDVDLSKLTSEHGIVLFVYPRADTPGCTTQACNYAGSYSAFTDLGYKVYGISQDKVEAQEKWAVKKDLNFPLLADTEAALIKKLGAFAAPKNTVRSSFIFEKGTGKLLKAVRKATPKDDAKNALAFIKEHHK